MPIEVDSEIRILSEDEFHSIAENVIGVVFGAITVGLVANAVFFIPAIDGAWFRVFLGTILLAAVFANERIRKRITGGI